MSEYICNPENFLNHLEEAQDGDIFCSVPNEHRFSNFSINKRIKLIGISPATALCSIDRPDFTICVDGVKLETLRVERIVCGHREAIAIAASGFMKRKKSIALETENYSKLICLLEQVKFFSTYPVALDEPSFLRQSQLCVQYPPDE